MSSMQRDPCRPSPGYWAAVAIAALLTLVPAGVLAQDDSGAPYPKEPDKCTGCQLCALRCPDFAINVTSPKKKEPKGSAKASGEIKEGVSEQGEKA